jgi:hypothetical protein
MADARKNDNLWSRLLSTPLPGDPAPAPDPAPDPSPDASPESFLHKVGSMLARYSASPKGTPTPAPNATVGPPAPPAAQAPSGSSSSWLHKLGDILALHHEGDAQPPAPSANATPAPKPASPAGRPASSRHAGRPVIAPPQAPAGASTSAGTNQAAVSATDMPAVGVPPIDASSLPSPGALAGELGSQLPYVAPRSGQKREADVTEQQGQDQKQTRTSWADGDQMGKITDSILKLPMIQSQMKQNELHRQLLGLAAYGMPYRLDLSPLAAIADSWVKNEKKGNDSNLEESALAQYRGRQAQRNTMEQALRDNDTAANSLSNTVLKAAQDFKNGSDTRDMYEKMADKASATNADPFGHMNPLQALTTMSHLVDRGMNSQKDQDAAQDIRNLQGMIANGSAVTDRNFPLTLAKVVGGSGRIAAYEVAREAGSPELARQFDQLWSTLANGRITPENMRDYANFVNLLARNHLAYRQIQAKRYAAISPRFGLQPEDTQALLPGSFVSDVPTGVAPGSGHGRSNVGGPGTKIHPSIESAIQGYFQNRNKGK